MPSEITLGRPHVGHGHQLVTGRYRFYFIDSSRHTYFGGQPVIPIMIVPTSICFILPLSPVVDAVAWHHAQLKLKFEVGQICGTWSPVVNSLLVGDQVSLIAGCMPEWGKWYLRSAKAVNITLDHESRDCGQYSCMQNIFAQPDQTT